ncbi:MAG: hypothetical protein M1820_009930 [Bogoriella megaspora]|nr:MAG: hypothetical protein M1820_009930 [Bogoriella megaspora]
MPTSPSCQRLETLPLPSTKGRHFGIGGMGNVILYDTRPPIPSSQSTLLEKLLCSENSYQSLGDDGEDRNGNEDRERRRCGGKDMGWEAVKRAVGWLKNGRRYDGVKRGRGFFEGVGWGSGGEG